MNDIIHVHTCMHVGRTVTYTCTCIYICDVYNGMASLDGIERVLKRALQIHTCTYTCVYLKLKILTYYVYLVKDILLQVEISLYRSSK